MEFVADNGIRFRDKRKKLTLEHFISAADGNATIFLVNDIIMDFVNGKYIGSYTLPF